MELSTPNGNVSEKDTSKLKRYSAWLPLSSRGNAPRYGVRFDTIIGSIEKSRRFTGPPFPFFPFPSYLLRDGS